MLPIERVVRRTQEIGLKCQRIPYKREGWFHPRRLFIEGRKCQVVSAAVYHHPNEISKVLHLPFPTSEWPDFFIYVSKDPQDPTTSFFVVPRGAVAKATSICSSNHWVFEYNDRWPLLSEDLEPTQLERRYEKLNWKMRAIIGVAKNHGCEVELVKGKKGFHWPRHVQNRILINGRKCQVMSASRVSADSSLREWNTINLNPPRDNWAEFLFFVVPLENGHNSIFIVPRDWIPKKTTTTLATGWFLDFADKWEPLMSSATAPRELPNEAENDHRKATAVRLHW